MNFVDLPTIAQIGATLAGFAALASVIRGTIYDSDAIFGVVANGVIALVFALFALRFGKTPVALRMLAAGFGLASGAWLVRELRVVYAAARDKHATYDRTSAVIGYAYVLAIVSPPVLGAAVAADVWPGEAALLYESALLVHVTAAALSLLDVVRRHTAFGGNPPAA